MGKSMLTWQWVKHHASKVRQDWAGMFWYSFYESGADMNHFCAYAMAYVTDNEPEKFLGQKASALSDGLLRALQKSPWLFVLDGAERLLVEYHRYDAAQRPDDEVGQSNRCIVPSDEDLLQKLCSGHESKVLISSRLMPSACLNSGGSPLPGVQHVNLTGLDPVDAEAMLVVVGIRGDSARIRSFLQTQFACHPLVLGVVAGLVRDNFEAPGDFDRWSRRTELNLATMDLKSRHTHILELAFRHLTPQARVLMARIAVVPDAVSWDEMLALNPYLPDRPQTVEAPDSPESDLLLSRLREWLNESSSDDDRAYWEERIQTRKANRKANLKEQQSFYEAYQDQLKAWERSPGVQSAPERLKQLCRDLRSADYCNGSKAALASIFIR